MTLIQLLSGTGFDKRSMNFDSILRHFLFPYPYTSSKYTYFLYVNAKKRETSLDESFWSDNSYFFPVANSGTGTHHPAAPGGGAAFPGAIQGGLGDFAGTGLVFPWATNARGKPRRGMMRRAVFSDLQRRGLEKRFQIQKYISKPDRKKLAEKLGLKDSQVRIFFFRIILSSFIIIQINCKIWIINLTLFRSNDSRQDGYLSVRFIDGSITYIPTNTKRNVE